MSDIFEGYAEHFDEEARLVILKALAGQTNGRLNESMIQTELELFAVNRSREYIRTQLRWLAQEARAVILTQVRGVMIAELSEQGANHLSRKFPIDGIKPPSRRKA
jgi:hypothetical protein